METKTILFADDDDALRYTIQEFFKDTPFQFDMAENGKEALEKALVFKYDLIVLDINMPLLKGNETVKLIKQKWPDIKVIAFTGLSAYSEMTKYYKDGFDDALSKFMDLEQFGEILKQHLKNPVKSLGKDIVASSNTPSDLSSFSKDELLKKIGQLEMEKQKLVEENKVLKSQLEIK